MGVGKKESDEIKTAFKELRRKKKKEKI